MGSVANAVHREPWNKGKIVGQKAPFKLNDIWALRVRFQMEDCVRELALFNLGIDSKLRGCDLVALKVRDVCHGSQLASRAVVMQHKTQRPVQFENTAVTRDAVQSWIKVADLKSDDFLFPSRIHDSPHLGTRQYPPSSFVLHPRCKANLAKRGKRLTHRNALREGSYRFAPSSVESVVLSVMRTALGDRGARGPATAAKLGPRYLQRISEAAGRLRPEIGEAQIPLPLQGD